MELTSTAVTVPASPEAVGILRVVAADAAAGADLSFDGYSDLELAIAEAAAVIHATTPTSIHCLLESEENSVRVSLSGVDSRHQPPPDDLALFVLEAVAGDLTIDLDAEQPTISFSISG